MFAGYNSLIFNNRDLGSSPLTFVTFDLELDLRVISRSNDFWGIISIFMVFSLHCLHLKSICDLEGQILGTWGDICDLLCNRNSLPLVIIKSPKQRLGTYCFCTVSYYYFLLLLIFLFLAVNLSIPKRKENSAACYETWYNDRSVSWEEVFNIEEPPP